MWGFRVGRLSIEAAGLSARLFSRSETPGQRHSSAVALRGTCTVSQSVGHMSFVKRYVQTRSLNFYVSE